MEKIRDWLNNNPSGSGRGYDSGDGSGSGRGSGVASFNGVTVFIVDGIPTIISQIKDAVCKGFILNSDLTLDPCFIVKGQGYFAHGKTLKGATDALREKIFENMDSDEAIEKFIEKFEKGKKYPGTEFFEWHHYLTGSCLMGRENFVKNKGLNLNAEFTVDEFMTICENDYGSEIIKKLKEKWEN